MVRARLGKCMPMNCAVVALAVATHGIWMRCTLNINGKTHSFWRAVDQDGNVLDILVQSRRNKQAAKRFFRKLLKGLQYVPRVIITDKLKSYGAAKREILPGVEHRQHKAYSIIERKTPTNPRGYVKRTCGVSNQPARTTLSLG